MHGSIKQNAKNNRFMHLLNSAKMALVSFFLPTTGNKTSSFLSADK